MLPATSNTNSIFFYDPRLHMTIGGRLLVRTLQYVSSLVLAVGAVTFLLSDIRWARSFGILLALLLTDYVLHLHEGDRRIDELSGRNSLNLAACVSPGAWSVFERAYDRSAMKRSGFFLEILQTLFLRPEMRRAFDRLDISRDEFAHKCNELLKESALGNGAAAAGSEARRRDAEKLMLAAFACAKGKGHQFIEVDDLLDALPRVEDPLLDRLFLTFGIEAHDLTLSLLFEEALRRRRGFWGSFFPGIMLLVRGRAHHSRHRIMNRAWTSRPTPTLDRVGTDLTDRARDGEIGYLVGHEEEYERLVDTLSRSVNPNALLVGDVGIGKETIVEHLAYELVHDRVPRSLFDKRLVSLHIAELVAGVPPEELQGRVERIVAEITMAENIILYIPDIHNLVKTSGTAYLSVADALMPVLMNNAFPLVGTTYPREFAQFIEPRSDFVGVFETIRVEQISEGEAEQVLVYTSVLLEERAKIVVGFGAIKMAVKLAKRYVQGKFLPASAEEVLKAGLVAAERRGEKRLTPETVVRAVEEKVHIPIHEAVGAEAAGLLTLESEIHKRFIDQDEAVSAVSEALREYRSGLARRGGPIASFLFVGPTGVGKTELSKVLARLEFGSEKAMIRFDMTEYQDKQSFFRFIGSPDGAVSGALTEAVLHAPYSLILLDEFEKAFPDILNLFLQVLDDGRLTDNLGRTIDFTNTIIIATSNAHSDIINESLRAGQSMSAIAGYLKEKLVDVYRPELLNRFSKIIVFKNLEMPDVKKIALLNMSDLAATLLEQGITLTADTAAIARIAQLGYEPAFGARPLRRVLDEQVRAPLAEKILKKELSRGSRITITARDDAFEFVV